MAPLRGWEGRGSSPKPGLILFDLTFSGEDGRELLAEIEADPLPRDIPVIVLTTSNARQDVARACELGASHYVVKPILLEQFLSCIRSIVQTVFPPPAPVPVD